MWIDVMSTQTVSVASPYQKYELVNICGYHWAAVNPPNMYLVNDNTLSFCCKITTERDVNFHTSRPKNQSRKYSSRGLRTCNEYFHCHITGDCGWLNWSHRDQFISQLSLVDTNHCNMTYSNDYVVDIRRYSYATWQIDYSEGTGHIWIFEYIHMYLWTLDHCS